MRMSRLNKFRPKEREKDRKQILEICIIIKYISIFKINPNVVNSAKDIKHPEIRIWCYKERERRHRKKCTFQPTTKNLFCVKH